MTKIRAHDEEDLIVRALEYYDRAVCAAVIEKSSIVARHRDGTIEDLSP
jgi:hypothetical protein